MSHLDQLRGRRVLVAGAGGFLGARLFQHLAACGIDVYGTRRTGSTTKDDRCLRIDLTDRDAVRQTMRDIRPDVVYHLAGRAVGQRELAAVEPTLRDNLMTTVNLLTQAAEQGCGRLVIAGSLEEPEGHASAVPSSPYAASKWAASAYGRMFHSLYHVPVVIARIFMVYGPGQRQATKLIPYVIRSLLRGEPPQLAGGTREIDWIYVDDVAAGLVAVGTAPAIEGATVDLGSGALISVRALAEQLVELTDSAAVPQFDPGRDRPMEQVRAARADEAYRRLNWRTTTSMAEGLRQTIQWHRADMLVAESAR